MKYPIHNIEVSLSKRLLSYFYPVRIRRDSSVLNSLLELYLYRGQLQLATTDALYSDGDRYRPMTAAFKKIKKELAQVKRVLVLGTGLGSTVNIMHRYGYHPHFTLVDHDKIVLQWALEFLHNATPENVTAVCADANEFVKNNTGKFDLLIVDIFSGRVVPPFVTTDTFLENCHDKINSGGHLVLNYIVVNTQEWERVRNLFTTVFPTHHIIEIQTNRILIATV